MQPPAQTESTRALRQSPDRAANQVLQSRRTPACQRVHPISAPKPCSAIGPTPSRWRLPDPHADAAQSARNSAGDSPPPGARSAAPLVQPTVAPGPRPRRCPRHPWSHARAAAAAAPRCWNRAPPQSMRHSRHTGTHHHERLRGTRPQNEHLLLVLKPPERARGRPACALPLSHRRHARLTRQQGWNRSSERRDFSASVVRLWAKGALGATTQQLGLQHRRPQCHCRLNGHQPRAARGTQRLCHCWRSVGTWQKDRLGGQTWTLPAHAQVLNLRPLNTRPHQHWRSLHPLQAESPHGALPVV
mmetsp:Transcript_67181/g.155946  ORF Transcript_67181/g.155946 Transcript_67181/m.155946 type:complete len:302 (+) Transcript_67181:694-1599(+)